MREKELQSRILLELGSNPDYRLFRNNSGVAWQGESRTERDRAGNLVVTLINPRRITYGLATGSADIIGIHRRIITPDMVGQTIGQFVSIEVKSERGRTTDDQKKWLAMVERFGGDAVLRKP